MIRQAKAFLIESLGPWYGPLRDIFWDAFALNRRTSLLWVGSFLVLGSLVWWQQERRRRGATGFLGYVFQKSVYLHPSAIVDYQYFVVSKVLFVLVLGSLSLSATTVANQVVPWLTEWLGASPWKGSALFVNFAFTLASLVAFDLGYFLGHYVMHKVPLLWELHRVHHSAEVLTPITSYREHPFDSLMQAGFEGVSMGLVTAAFTWAYPDVQLLTLGGVNILYLPSYLASNLRHSHIGLSYPGAASHVFSSPLQHQAHHGAAPQYMDVNFGLFLSVWDWMAGTLHIPRPGETIASGLVGEPGQDYPNLWKLYTVPLRRIGERLGRSLVRAGAPPPTLGRTI